MPFRLPPTASTRAFIFTVSRWRWLPRKKRCSRKWLTPLLSSVSCREPTRAYTETIAECRCGVSTVTTVSPEGKTARWCLKLMRLGARCIPPDEGKRASCAGQGDAKAGPVVGHALDLEAAAVG